METAATTEASNRESSTAKLALNYRCVIAEPSNELDLHELAAHEHFSELSAKFEPMGRLLNGLAGLQISVNLTRLSLLNIENLHLAGIESLGNFAALETLELGRCEKICWPLTATVLPALKNLKRLRLECSANSYCSAYDVLDATSSKPHLKQLELVNFIVVNGFDFKLGQCIHLEKFLIAPILSGKAFTTLDRIARAVKRAAAKLQAVTCVINTECLSVQNEDVDWNDIETAESIWLDTLGIKMCDMYDGGHFSWESLQIGLVDSLPGLVMRVVQVPFEQTFNVQMDG